MRELFVFGYSASLQRCHTQASVSTSTPLHSAPGLEILWSSWCDVIILQALDQLTYHGTSLTKIQALYIQSLKYSPSQPLISFGRVFDHGLKGVISRSGQEVTVFHSDQEIQKGKLEFETLPFESEVFEILDLKFTSKESILVSLKSKGDANSAIVKVPSLDHFLTIFSRQRSDSSPERLSIEELPRVCAFPTLQWATNATTLTALDEQGKIYTHALDKRYPKCLGRELTDSDTVEPIPYLSESSIGKIASGGYYTAAISLDGELYIWGQSPPGTDDELSILQKHGDDEEDEFVRCIEIKINGTAATVTDVAVGLGHVLVAAELPQHGVEVVRAVFAAGCNERGQLGFAGRESFVQAFTELEMFRGRRIRQLVCAGWSSYVVVECG